jgi:DNA-binding transcriptional LysR family regulator
LRRVRRVGRPERRHWFPLPDVVPTSPSSHGYEAGFLVGLVHKDLHLATTAAVDFDLRMETAAAAQKLFKEASGAGVGTRDLTALALYYLAAHGTPSTVEEVSKHTVVFYVDSLLQVGDLDLGRYLPGATARFTSTNIFAQLEATRRGVGIGLLPPFLAGGVPNLRRIPVGTWPQLAFTLAARRDSVGRPAVQVVREALHRGVHLRRDELN